MAIKPTTLNINVELRTRLEEKYPEISFTRLVEMGMELLDKEDNNLTPPPTIDLTSIQDDINKIKRTLVELSKSQDTLGDRLSEIENYMER